MIILAEHFVKNPNTACFCSEEPTGNSWFEELSKSKSHYSVRVDLVGVRAAVSDCFINQVWLQTFTIYLRQLVFLPFFCGRNQKHVAQCFHHKTKQINIPRTHRPGLWGGENGQKSFPAWEEARLCRTEMEASMASPQPQKPQSRAHCDLKHIWTWSCRLNTAQRVFVHLVPQKLPSVMCADKLTQSRMYGSQRYLQRCRTRPQKCSRKMFPLQESKGQFRVSQQPVGAATVSYDCARHGTHFQPWPGCIPKPWPFRVFLIMSRLICGRTKVSSSTRSLPSSAFQSTSLRKWKNKYEPGLCEWWFSWSKAAAYVESIISTN